MRRQLLVPTMLAGGVTMVLATSGLATSPGEADADHPRELDTEPIASHAVLRPLADWPRTGESTTTTTTAPPTTTTTAPPTTTTTAPPTTTTTAPPAPEPEPEIEVAPSTGGGIVCPVAGAVDFVDSWGAARSGGRSHTGTDMMAAYGTPTVAPVSGTVEHRGSSLGGLSWYVHGDDGNTYYGTHLSGYENDGVGWVAAGTVIGYVGDSGNAAGTPHLHFEFHPGGGSPVNPYDLVAGAC
jgi:murein DD-endopeptidase MepM/ murein hydrolase activator NlpD